MTTVLLMAAIIIGYFLLLDAIVHIAEWRRHDRERRRQRLVHRNLHKQTGGRP